jgi:urea transporter
MGTAPSIKEMCASDWKLQLLEGTFRAFGQVVFMNNPVSGLFLWIAMLVACPLVALCALLCALAANVTSLGLELDASTMASGMYGYNAVLVGAGVATLLDCAVWRMIVLVIFVAAPLTLVMYLYFFYKFNVLPLQLPYNGVMILLLFSAMYLDALAVDAVVMSGWAFGVLLMIAIVLYSRILAGVALVGSLLASVLLPMETGMGAYNVVFTLAFFGTQCVPSIKTFVLALLAVVLTGVVQTALAELLGYVNLPVLTLPFCLAVFPFVALGSDTGLFLIPADDLSTPEEHWKKYLYSEDDEDGEELVLTLETDLETGDAPVVATEKSPLIPK